MAANRSSPSEAIRLPATTTATSSPPAVDDDVPESAEVSALALHGTPAQRAQGERLRAVEVELVVLEENERREDRDLVVAHGRSRQRQEPVHLVAAENVEADRAQRVAVEQQVDGAPKLDSVQPHGQREQLCSGELSHSAAIVPGPPCCKPGLQKPSSPRSGTKRQGTERRTAGPSGLRTITCSCCTPRRPTGTTSRPRGSSCS